ncbi:HmuY family protein [Belliella kenyensis]|uniref:HmuY family protein n=1 Tax=Belliella kenyensis TaxID=1472724 RepID=A0ABV8ENR2_9BACT|nr:HmuY family protein [Belliella kenyensis]MCH7401483.1 HmuY family protein [Belliella kenyensis]MDN3603236.1 HmuY family protein [Belliella kenyensis]
MKNNNYLKINVILAAFGMMIASCTDNENPTVETPPVEEAYIELNGGGTTFPNMVFVDLSAEEQVAVRRDSWDFAFSNGSAFQVLINGTTGAMAYETAYTVFSEVDEAYVNNLKSSGSLDLSFNNLSGILRVDNPSNPLNNGSVFGNLANNEQEAKVFIVNRGESGADTREWIKVKIYVSNNKYIIEYAPSNSNEVTKVEVSKNESHNFIYFSIDNGIVEVEPVKEKWDFVWTAGTSSTPYAQATDGTLAYFFQDLVYHNIYGGVGAKEMLESDLPYEGFDIQDLQGLNFNVDNRLTIGSNWRSGGGPTSSPSARGDRYYIIKDKAGNHYKLRFLSLTTGGERGRPSLEYALIK